MWPVALLEKVIPRHLSLIYLTNYFFINEIKSKFNCSDDDPRVERMSLV